jgi:hypothetical protein
VASELHHELTGVLPVEQPGSVADLGDRLLDELAELRE